MGLALHSNHQTYLVSEINVNFGWKSQIPPCIFKAPAEGVPLELGTDAMGQKLELWGFTRWPKS